MLIVAGLLPGKRGTAFCLPECALDRGPFLLLGKQIQFAVHVADVAGAVPAACVGIGGVAGEPRRGKSTCNVLPGIFVGRRHQRDLYSACAKYEASLGKNHRWLPWLALPIGLESGFSSAGREPWGRFLLNYSENGRPGKSWEGLLFGLVWRLWQRVHRELGQQ